MAGGLQRTPHGGSVSVGVFAYNEERRIGRALDSLLMQECPRGLRISEILVVTSGCTDTTETIVESKTQTDGRIELVRQPVRLGKASAINAFFERAHGDILVLLNGDARLEPGSLNRLLVPFTHHPEIEIACGLPIPDSDGPPLVRLFAESQWGLHNRALLSFGRMGVPNHCCDEFLAIRRGFVSAIPPNLINDGAYLAAVAEEKHRPVLIVPEARVYVEVPRTLRGALMQRRRIVRGHRQIYELLNRPTNTLEALMFRNPSAVWSALRPEFFQRAPDFLRFLFLLLPIEALANLLATLDRLRSAAYQPAWAMIE